MAEREALLPDRPSQPHWWEDMHPFDAAFHIATRLDSLLSGVEDEETLAECQAAAEVWMSDLREIAACWKAGAWRWMK